MTDFKKYHKHIAVDLDGTLAFYDFWRGIEHIGKPIEPMLNIVKGLINSGNKVKIFTARACEGEIAIRYVKKWCIENGLGDLEVVNYKNYGTTMLIDDRARQVIYNEGIIIT